MYQRVNSKDVDLNDLEYAYYFNNIANTIKARSEMLEQQGFLNRLFS